MGIDGWESVELSGMTKGGAMRIAGSILLLALVVSCGDINVPEPDPGGGDTGGDPGSFDTVEAACKAHTDCAGKVAGLSQCQVPVCDPDTWSCIPFDKPDGSDCNDQDLCTEDDWCEEGQCVGRPVFCDDGNLCTDDFCDTGGNCDVEPNEEPCQDGDKCTLDDRCFDTQCRPGEPIDCDDGNQCTEDNCKPAVGCVNKPIAGCEDKCDEAFQCNDDNPCTKDDCNGGNCVHFPMNGEHCNDGNECTDDDFCEEWLCIGHVDRDCDDENPCTNDGCNPQNGCFHEPNNAPCDDGDSCTTDDFCGEGQCQGGKPKNCDDGNACTEDFCSQNGACPSDVIIGVEPIDPSETEIGPSCCHVKCPEPNPDCKDFGCACGNGNKICDPKYADTCKKDGLTIGGSCVCGKANSPCGLTECCIGGACVTGCKG